MGNKSSSNNTTPRTRVQDTQCPRVSQSFDARTSTLRSRASVSPGQLDVSRVETRKAPAPAIPPRPSIRVRVLPTQSNVSEISTNNGGLLGQDSKPASVGVIRSTVIEQRLPKTNTTQNESEFPIGISRTIDQFNPDHFSIASEKIKCGTEENKFNQQGLKTANILKTKSSNEDLKDPINGIGNQARGKINLENLMFVENIKPNNIVNNLIPNKAIQNAKESEGYKLERLSAVSPDYQLASILFRKYMEDSEIVKIERIYNQHTLALYTLKKANLQSYRRDVEEILLFHGTNAVEINSICKYNFDFRVYKSQGICFSPYSSFANNYCNEEDGKKVMLMCKVLFDTYSKFGKKVLIKSQDDVYYPEYKITYRD